MAHATNQVEQASLSLVYCPEVGSEAFGGDSSGNNSIAGSLSDSGKITPLHSEYQVNACAGRLRLGQLDVADSPVLLQTQGIVSFHA